jgi:hypothetical protein
MLFPEAETFLQRSTCEASVDRKTKKHTHTQTQSQSHTKTHVHGSAGIGGDDAVLREEVGQSVVEALSGETLLRRRLVLVVTSVKLRRTRQRKAHVQV